MSYMNEQKQASRCIIWGLGIDYERILNQIKFEILKGNLEVVATVSDVDSKYFGKKDGFSVISSDRVSEVDFDYLIIASDKYFGEIKKEAVLFGVSSERIINGKIFERALFDWSRYISLVENPVTILSDDCWGGYIYHDLYLQFASPCINVNWDKKSYIRFAKDPLYYLEQPLELEIEGDIRNNQCPIGRIGSGNKKITMNFVHVPSFEQAKNLWDKRKKRINKDRIFVKLGLPANYENCGDILKEFSEIDFPKVCFYSGKTDVKNVVYLPRFEWFVSQGERAETLVFSDYIRMQRSLFYRDVDILQMLNGYSNYIRSIEYSSGNDSEWLNVDELQQKLKNMKK